MLFISHSTENKSHALDLKHRLRARGYVCEQQFLDSDQRSGIKLGEKWEKVIYDNLRDCQALLVLCSPTWLQSNWCFAELAVAKMNGKQIFPIVVEECDRLSLIEFQATFINNLESEKNEEAFERLFQDLKDKGLGPTDWLPWPNPDLKDANGQVDACPFPGLQAFDERYAAVYFGREREKQKLLEDLRQMRTNGEPRLLMIVGGSGSGKSSLLLAGILPTLKHRTFCDDWLVLSTVRFARRKSPNALFESLADDIISHYPPDARQQLPDRKNLLHEFTKPVSEAANSFSKAVRELAIALGRANATALLPIDQFEEFLNESSASEGQRFLEFLKELCQYRDNRLVVVGTMRSDYLDVYEHHVHHLKTPCFKEWRLKPFDLTQLSRIIQLAAKRGHVDVEGDLVEQLKKDTPSADSLPQLSFALEQLYRRFASGRERPILTTGDYTQMGRIDGLIKSAAEQLFDPHTQSNAIVKAVRLCFVKHLANVSDGGDGGDGGESATPFVKLSARWDDLDPPARPILEQLVNQRLLVKTQPQDVVFVEVAHEVLFRCWPLLNSWLNASADIIRWRRDIRRDQRSAASSGRVWKRLTSVQFAVAKRWPTSRREELEDEEIKWIYASANRRSLAWTGVVMVMGLLMITTSVAWWQRGLALRANVNAQKRADETESVFRFIDKRVFGAARPKGQDGGLGASATIRDAVDVAEKLISSDFPNEPLAEASVRDALGSSYIYLGQPDLAIEQHELALKLRSDNLGHDDLKTVASMSNLAIACQDAHKNDRAIVLLKQVLATQKTKLGTEHEETLASMNNLAASYLKAGRFNDALQLSKEAYVKQKSILGPTHEKTLASMCNLAASLMHSNRHDEGIAMYKNLLKLFEDSPAFGPKHPDTLGAISNLGFAYEFVHRQSDALPLFLRAFDGAKNELGLGHFNTQRYARNLANCYSDLGTPEHAQKICLVSRICG